MPLSIAGQGVLSLALCFVSLLLVVLISFVPIYLPLEKVDSGVGASLRL